MDNSHSIEVIDASTFDDILRKYPDVVPEKLKDLDNQRYKDIPSQLKKRADDPHLTKDEVAALVDWKLSHGKFRPSLKGLVQQNAPEVVTEVTKEGFAKFQAGDQIKASLNILTKLRGIGPATASLLLSVYDPDRAPFFSDELFRWASYQGDGAQGWSRDIKYTLKEYLELVDQVHGLQKRLKADHQRDVTAVEVEKVAYVLDKGAVDSKSSVPDKSKASSKKRKLSATAEAEDKPRIAASEAIEEKPSKTALSSRASVRRSTRK